MLLQQSRPEMAEAELGRGLQLEPENGHIHALLGLCLIQQKRPADAKQNLREAMRLEPAYYLPHYLMGLVHLDDDKLIDAKRACNEALRLDPYQACVFWLSAHILFRENKKEDALKALDQGLAQDPEDVDCLNLRAQILTQMGRNKEAAGTIERSLAASPEDASTHATQGWALLHSNKPREALKHFDEALRLEPGHGYAKAGMVEALKARFLIYRIVLGFFLWMSRLDGRTRTGLIIGAYIGYQVLKNVARHSDELRPYALVLVGLYVGFVLLTWTAVPLFNLTLRLNTHGWHALDKEDKIATDGFGALILTGVTLVGLAIWLGQSLLYQWAAYCGVMAIVFSTVVMNLAWRTRPVMFYAGATAAGSGLIALILTPFDLLLTLPAWIAFAISLLIFMFSPHFSSNRN